MNFILRSEHVRQYCRQYLETVPLGMEVKFSDWRDKSKTRQQENYWHSLVGLIAKDQGITKLKMKEDLKAEWLPWVSFIDSKGQGRARPKSTSELSREDYSLLIEETQSLCEQLSIKYPNPSTLGMDIR